MSEALLNYCQQPEWAKEQNKTPAKNTNQTNKIKKNKPTNQSANKQKGKRKKYFFWDGN